MPNKRAVIKGNKRLWSASALLACIIIVTTLIIVVPSVRYQLRASFTRLPENYVELYFSSAPTLANPDTVAVPLTLVEHGGTARTYQLTIALVDDKQVKVNVVNRSFSAVPEVPASGTVSIEMPARTAGLTVYVGIQGSTENVHYRLTQGA